MKIFTDKQYNWMMRNLPFRLMYAHRYIDSQHKMWIPRWGWSEQQKNGAYKRAQHLLKLYDLDELKDE